MSKAHFLVDSRIGVLLSENYRSSERALKELVDNAWDADADEVHIDLPEPFSGGDIVIRDDGHGMTEQELRNEYLFVANDRRRRKGDRTTKYQRQVKGRKGIGKFAGLMAGNIMRLNTHARGMKYGFELHKKDLLDQPRDIETIPIEIQTEPCSTEMRGTVITLSGLNQSLKYPNPNTLRQLLIQDYGRETGFAIYVDGKRLSVDDVSGENTRRSEEVDELGPVHLTILST